MKERMGLATRLLAGMACAVLLAGAPAFADKPSWAGEGGKHGHKEKHGQKGEKGGGGSGQVYFDDHHHVIIRDYYAGEFRSGHCPPGLAKKNNGCLPPGQAKKWRMGQPLPREVVYYDLPPSLVVSLGTPPPGHRYVRVAGDILLIAIGTALVVDALQDLAGL
jgi:Ni/Co efflux regulator RcnB